VFAARRRVSDNKRSGPWSVGALLLLANKKPLVAVYAGSFDPVTNGHLDLIQRCAPLVDKLVVAVLRNADKYPLFTLDERVAMLENVLSDFGNVEVDAFDGLLVDYAQRKDARLLLRGIRAVSDYEYELQMALMNRRLAPDIETMFMMAGEAYSFISSKLVKEVIGLGGNVSGLVPPSVEEQLKQRFPGRL
jgi:pantetheine-phosphate adenylyltransferase